MLDVTYRGDRVFDLARHFGFKLRRRGALQSRSDCDDWEIDIRELQNVQLLEADEADEAQQNENDDRWNRLPN